LLARLFVASVAYGVTQTGWPHALSTDPTVIERINVGLVLPSELSLTWIFWLLFGLWVAQNSDRARYLFLGAGSGVGMGSIVAPIGIDMSMLSLGVALLIGAWICRGQPSNKWIAAITVSVFGAMTISMVFSAHIDISQDPLIRIIAVISMMFGASFIGGLLRQFVVWFPGQTPMGLRILSSWTVAFVTMQIAMSAVG